VSRAARIHFMVARNLVEGAPAWLLLSRGMSLNRIARPGSQDRQALAEHWRLVGEWQRLLARPYWPRDYMPPSLDLPRPPPAVSPGMRRYKPLWLGYCSRVARVLLSISDPLAGFERMAFTPARACRLR